MRYFTWLAPLACLLITACTATQGGARFPPPIDPTDETPATPTGFIFPGIINNTGVTSAQRERVTRRFVFNIHGMGCTQRNYNERFIRSLGEYGYHRETTPPHDLLQTNLVAQDVHSSATNEDANCDGKPDDEPPNTIGWFDIPLAEPVEVYGEGLDCNGASGPPCRYTTFGSLRVDHLKRGDEDLFIYTYFVHDDFWALQQRYLAEDIRQPGRALLNGGAKREVVDRGFSDAVAYLGPLGSLAQQSIRTSVCVMLWHASRSEAVALRASENCLDLTTLDIRSDVEFSFITHSLGSRMLLDALLPPETYGDARQGEARERNDADRANVAALASRTRVIYMAANQIPLLGVGSVRLRRGQQALAGDECDAISFIYCRGRLLQSNPLHIVGFHDPDDLLGFRADSGMVESLNHRGRQFGLHFTNVHHRNANQWLGVLTWPPAAHDQELNRETSRRLIFCGGTADSNGRLHPNMEGCGRVP